MRFATSGYWRLVQKHGPPLLYLRCWDNRSNLVHDDWVGHFCCEGILEEIPSLIAAVNRCAGLVG
jgi:hypothetical protein